ncbi:hypothetical protein M8J76_013980 [Diaphorina citri]|nr:hypothetical protein M8J75_000628 [Diaphorina citri]KAI5719728.1 hypothetical protein M8J76_013980 [Diaphorina citri]KAI5721234.1 hypothetical protein M8J77_017964 [Diaphorina citri]
MDSLALVSFLITAGLLSSAGSKITQFVFPEFPYKDSSKQELMFHEYESACEQSPQCVHLKALNRVRCVRECVSPSCYMDIYQKDPLEEGEVDVRLNSFKGCFIQRLGRPR